MDNKAHGNGIITHKNCKFGGLWENGYEVIGTFQVVYPRIACV